MKSEFQRFGADLFDELFLQPHESVRPDPQDRGGQVDDDFSLDAAGAMC